MKTTRNLDTMLQIKITDVITKKWRVKLTKGGLKEISTD
jgi:hypothetical protein